MKQIAEALPELSEPAMNKVADLIDGIITEQVESRVNLLEAKTLAFIRLNIDQLKEQALKELEEENELFRNARLFEAVRSLMTLEVVPADEQPIVDGLTLENTNLQEENKFLTKEMSKLLEKNETLDTNLKVMNTKLDEAVEALETLLTENEQLEENVALLEEKNEPFKSSEKALIITEVKENSKTKNSNNEFLTEGVMNLMPHRKE